MLPEHTKIMVLMHGAGEVIGRKKLQKMVYIGKKLNLPFQEKYTFHMYGPYSEELTLRVEELCGFGFVTEVKEKKAGYYQYRYEVTEKGQEFLDAFPNEWLDHRASGVIEHLNGHSSRFLELVSTVLYFEDLPEAQMKEKVFALKKSQNYSEEDMQEALDFINSLKNLQ
ncbi:YwgA family protein [Alteribacillus sp. HJP-4]|uniref:YwgA family protein n=1 Tax=Alteribacillus sp. HJP-4 TaxID=2775394 RepID=UPI0035CCEF57